MAGTSTITVFTQYSNQTESDISGTVTDSFTASLRSSFASGTGAFQANRYYRDTTTGTTAGSADLVISYVLSGLPGGQGMEAVRKVYLENLGDPTTGTPVYLVTGSMNGWSNGLGSGAKVPVLPGGALLNLHPSGAGVVVTAGSNDTIAVVIPQGTTGAYRLSVEGYASAGASMMAGEQDAYDTPYNTNA